MMWKARRAGDGPVTSAIGTDWALARAAGSIMNFGLVTWGSALLHPRLYAVARSAHRVPYEEAQTLWNGDVAVARFAAFIGICPISRQERAVAEVAVCQRTASHARALAEEEARHD